MIRKHDYSDLITVIVVNNLCNHKMQVFNAFYIEMVGAERIIYGADFPWNNCDGIQADISAINNLDLSSEEKEKILGGNLLPD